MTREMAVINIPVISIYQSDLLSVDKYLIGKGLMKIDPQITYEAIISFVNKPSNSVGEQDVLKEGLQSFDLMKQTIYNLKYE